MLMAAKSPHSLKPAGRLGFALQVMARSILSAGCPVFAWKVPSPVSYLSVEVATSFPRVFFCTSYHFS